MWQSVLGSPYKSAAIGSVDTSFVANLVFVTAGTYCADLTGGDVDTLGYISAGVALTPFTGIVLYHVYLRVKDNNYCKAQCLTRCKELSADSRAAGDTSPWEDSSTADEAEDDDPLLTYRELQEAPAPAVIGYTL